MPTSKEELLRRGLKPHDIQHNQRRRAEWQDYGGCGLYMITLCIERRHPFFGYLEGNIKAKRGTADFPHIVLSPLGRIVLENELPKIHSLYPQIELWQAAIMPDHLHLLFYIREPLPQGKHLGHIISSFKGGCSRAWWALTATGKTDANATGTAATDTRAVVPAASAAVKATGPALFEAGYHDRIIRRPGMLETIKRYMNDNPLRVLMRRQLPYLMERRLHLRIGTHEYAAFGALFLLKRAEKEQVFYHRRDKDTGIPTEQTEGYKREMERQLAEARTGVVLVSPGISKGESLVINAAIEEGLPVIHLQKKPIERYWKPERRRFEACARGTLLILAPWGLDEEIMSTALKSTGTPSDYARFHRLNNLAEEICNTTDATLLNVTTIA
ncbi:MAG: hypothetical protein IJ826_01675 [Bacteroidaceae bacterium]|nr:hypothetical protein [Bacteroidaceae bacterium]